jgi:hypothetical protein
MWNAYNFPVFLLSESSTLTLQEVIYCLTLVKIFMYGLSVQLRHLLALGGDYSVCYEK